MKRLKEPTVPITIRIEEVKLKKMIELAIKKSQVSGEYYNHQDLIKELINNYLINKKD